MRVFVPLAVAVVALALPGWLGGAGASGGGGGDAQANGRIVFVTGSSFEGEIATVNPDGTGIRELGIVGERPSWSPDGRRIAYFAQRGNNGEIHIVGARGQDDRRIAVFKYVFFTAVEMDWSPDGRTILLFDTMRGDLYVMNSDGSNRRKLAVRYGGTGFSFAPDGRSIVSGGACPPNASFRLSDCLVRTGLDGRGVEVLLRRKGRVNLGNGGIDWSGANGLIAYVWTTGSAPTFTLNVVRADGSGDRVIVPFKGNAPEEPSWSPDGKKLVAKLRRGRKFFLHVLSPQGRILNRVVEGRRPDWCCSS